MEFEKVNLNNVERLATLANEVWHEFFPSILTKDQIDYMVDKFQSLHALKDALEHGYIYHLVKVKGEYRGYFGYKYEDNRMFISKVYLLKDVRGQHIASKIFEYLEQEAHQHHVDNMWLTVNKYNTHAKEVYESKGFRVIDAVVSDIGRGYVMDDFIMQKDC